MISKNIFKPTKSDLELAQKMKDVIDGLHRRMGRKMCKELDVNCLNCKTRILIAFLNEWIDVLE